LSGTQAKAEEAHKLGATEFYATRNVEKLDIGRPVDHLIITTSSLPDWNLLLPVLALGGTIFPLTVSEGDLSLPAMAILAKGLRIQGILPCSRGLHVKMLRFAALHGIRPVIEQFPMNLEGIEEAFAKLEAGKVRYRAVLVV